MAFLAPKMKNSLSCHTKDYATLDDFEGSPDVEIDFAKDIHLNKFDFIWHGMGERPTYCQQPFIQGLASDGSGARVIYTSCDTMGCPSCSKLWALEQVFKAAVHIEAYARFSGSRPCWFTASIGDNRDITLEGIRKFSRNTNIRLKKQGIEAGLKVLHAHRILDEVKAALRVLTKSSDSAGFYKYLRDDHKEGNLDKINEFLGTDFITVHDCLKLAIHSHGIGFPGNIKITGTKDLIIKKHHLEVDNRDIWTLGNAEAVVKNLMYLISHCGQLERGKGSHMKPVSPFGEMYKKSVEKLVSPGVLEQIRIEILEILNQGRNKKLVLNDGSLCWGVPEDKEEKTYLPMSDFRLTSLESHENIRAFVSGVRDTNFKNAVYIDYLIDTYNVLCDSSEVPQKFKRLFVEPFKELPDFVKVMASYSPIRAIFERGLKAPPDTFKFNIIGHSPYSG
jgi:hypothetical protein